MAFEDGNQFWRKRAKHGRDLIFSSPEKMWEAAKEYFEYIDANPWLTHEQKVVGKEVIEVEIKHPIPYTMQGLLLFMGVARSYLRVFKLDKEKCTPDFLAVIEKIEDIIYNQKFTGASVDLFNANIIARDLGLADKKEVKGKVQLTDEDIVFD